MSVFSIVNTWQQQPFARGVSDCCAFVDHVVYRLTGAHYLPAYGENYQVIIDAHGDLRAAVTHYVGCDPVPFDQLTPGDIALIEIKSQQTIGVLLETGNVAAVIEHKGLREIRADFCDEGWRVGH